MKNRSLRRWRLRHLPDAECRGSRLSLIHISLRHKHGNRPRKGSIGGDRWTGEQRSEESNAKISEGEDSSHASAARVWSLRRRKQMLPSPERPELYGFVCLYSTLLPQAGRQLELCWRTSRDSHPSEDLSKLRTGVSLWADGIMAGTACQGCPGLSGYRSAPYLAVL